MTTPTSFNNKYVRDYDPDAPTSVEMTKLAWELGIRNPDAMVLNVYLATKYSGSSLSGAINPEGHRVRHQINLTEETHASAVAHLIKSGYWKVSFRPSKRVAFPGVQAEMLPAQDEEQNFDLMSHEDIKQVLLNRGIDSIDRYIPTFIEQARREKPRLKKVHVALNGMKVFSRYAPDLSGLAKLLALRFVMQVAPVYNDLGFKEHGKNALNYNFGKICHSVWFNHPMMKAKSQEEIEQLAAVKTLTEEMVADTFWTRVSFASIADRFDLGTNPTKALTSAIRQIQEAGWFDAKIELGNGDDDFGLVVVLRPTKKVHDIMWDFELHPGGHSQTQWETKRGFNPEKPLVEGPDPYENLPKLGFHWLYLLKSKSGQMLTVGQSTVPLRVRLAQHQTFGSNRTVDAAIRAINADPTDSLEIEYIGQVHYTVCSQYEMRALRKMQELGHEMFNNLSNADENWQSIHMDARFASYTPNQQQDIKWKSRSEYGDVIDLRELPKPVVAPTVQQEGSVAPF
jgi:hypothetical protein